ncbi:hypothetical protein D7252_02035 [Microbacterium sp. CGR2]|nr:hypothetical protein D7252_02035 [Microbacterium sp. CGR2]
MQRCPTTRDRYGGGMLQALRTFGRILARHWPALAAWYLGGEAAHQLLVQLAGFVGGLTTLGGLLLLPLAVAARLISYVAMYLTVQSSLRHRSPDRDGGHRQFAHATLTAILPFSIFYAAWGMLDADLIEFFRIASSIALRDAGYDLEQLGDRGGIVAVGLLPVVVLVVALAARLVLARFGERLPSWTVALAAYAELLWTFMLVTLVGQWWARAQDWIAGRAGFIRLQDLGDWFAANIVPVAALWEASLWLFGIIVAAVVVPAAWLTVAGVIYGTSFDATPIVLRRIDGAPSGTASRLRKVVMRRFEELWAAVALVWRGGPVVFGCTALAYALWAAAEGLGSRTVLQLIGGHETAFWSAFLPLILVAVATIAEPLRVAIIATGFDAVIGRPEAAMGTRASGVDSEPGAPVGSRDLELERAVNAIGQHEDRKDDVGP